ncbi:hypothetical protein MUG91_G94n90 [Manis pentadactyla]|nr:hypothetical protein MUG91_G94n90 [Manis pentadactyla]
MRPGVSPWPGNLRGKEGPEEKEAGTRRGSRAGSSRLRGEFSREHGIKETAQTSQPEHYHLLAEVHKQAL